METRVTGVHLRSARRSVLLECVQPQGILEIKFTAELPYDSYLRLLRYTCSKNRTELMNATNLNFEIADYHTLVIHDQLEGSFSPSYHFPKSCKAWIVKAYLNNRNGAWLTILPVAAQETSDYSISLDEYNRFRSIAGLTSEANLTDGLVIKSIGVVGIDDISHLFITIDENSNIHFQNCVLVKKFEVSAELPN